MKGNNQAYKLWLCLLCSFLLLPLEIQAQEKGDSITGKVHKIDEVTVTARRPLAKVTTGSPVQLINKEDIKNLGLQNMADAVRRFAGTNVRDYGGIGGLKTVSIRNLGAAHTAVSYDGVVVSNSQAGQIDIGRFSLDNVSSLHWQSDKMRICCNRPVYMLRQEYSALKRRNPSSKMGNPPITNTNPGRSLWLHSPIHTQMAEAGRTHRSVSRCFLYACRR